MDQKLTKNMRIVVLAAAAILMVPLLAMQFTDEVAWDLFDFVAAGILLLGTGFLYVLLTWKARSARTRIIIGAVLACGLLYIWAELAVGIFTDWGS
jgi:hypothetical protein